MRKLSKFLATGTMVVMLAVSGLGVTKAKAASTSNVKLTAYNSKGTKVYVNATKDLQVTWYTSGWYKGTLKYTNYTKKNGKWVKGTKTSTIYVPSSSVKKYTTNTTSWVKTTKEIDDAFLKNNGKSENPIIAKGSYIYKSSNDKDFLYAHDSKGNSVKAKTISPINSYAESYDVYDDFDKDGIADWEDDDVDNDGITNYDDYDNDNDGIADDIEYYYYQDFDGDGIVNIDDDETIDYSKFVLDNDTDNDGIKNDNDLGYVTKYSTWSEEYWVSYVDYYKKTTTKSYYKTTKATQAYSFVWKNDGITLAEYNKIKLGMTYDQVVSITHDKGILQYSYSGKGYSFKEYEFRQDGDEYKYAWIDFDNGKVSYKSEDNLH